MKGINLFFNGFRKGMESFGSSVNTIVNLILLSVVYFVGVGITSAFARLMKKNFLETKISKNKTTYWSGLDLKKKQLKEYYRQF